MANTNIKFYKVSSMPETLVVGGIYFNDSDRTIRIATSTTSSSIYAGIKDATYTDQVLTITKSNGSTVTVDLSDVASSTAMAAALNNKVDKVAGKSLVSDTEITKLAGIAAGAQANKIESIKVNGTALAIDSSKAVNITIDSYDDTEVKADIKANTDAITVLNGTGVGSVSKTAETAASAAVSKLVGGAPEAYDTLKEISDWIEGHGEAAAELTTKVNANSGAIATLNGTGAGSVTKTATDIVTNKIAALDKTDTAVSGQFVTRVTETDGIISVTRKALEASDIPDIDATKVTLTDTYAASTTYTAPIAGDNVELAISKLAKGVADATSAGVTSFAGETGAITLETPNTTAKGHINLSVNTNKVLSASIVGLGSAAYTDSDAYATADQGAVAARALQSISGSGDTYVTAVANSKFGTTQTITVAAQIKPISDAIALKQGLADAYDVKSYVDSQVSSALVWEEFN